MKWYQGVSVVLIFLIMTGIQPSLAPGTSSDIPLVLKAATADILLQHGLDLLADADAFRNNREFQAALNPYKQAIACLRLNSFRQLKAETLVHIGWMYANLGQQQEALEYYRNALTLFRDIRNRRDESGTLTYIGMTYFTKSRYDEALTYFQQALNLAESLGADHVKVSILNWIGETWTSLGRFTDALTYYQRTLTIARKLKNRVYEGRILISIGSAYVGRGDYPQAIHAYQTALKILTDEDDQHGLGILRLSLGVTYMRMGNANRALQEFLTARDILQQVNDHENEATTLISLGGIYEEQGEYLKALGVYEQALTLQQSPVNKAVTYNNAGKVWDRFCWDTHNVVHHPEANQFYQQSLDISREIGVRTIEARTLNNIGELHIHLSFYENADEHLRYALRSLRKALEMQQASGDQANVWMTLSNIGRVYELQGKAEEALMIYRQALDLSETLIAATGVEELKIDMQAQAISTYERLFLLLVKQDRIREAFEWSERARARAFLDQVANLRINPYDHVDASVLRHEQELRRELTNIEKRLRQQQAIPEQQRDLVLIDLLQSQLHTKHRDYEEILLQLQLNNPEYTSLVRVSPLTLPEIQAHLNQETALISYMLTENQIYAFVITSTSLNMVELALTKKNLEQQIQAFRSKNHPNVDSIYQRLETLYQKLITPIKPFLNTPLIGIIPHNALHYLPFAALTDGMRYFSDQYTLFSLPSASVLSFLPVKPLSGRTSILALANSQGEGFTPLFYAEEEVRSIAAFYARYYTTHLQNHATETAFKRHAGSFSILHLAAHGELNTMNPLFSRIWLAPDEEQDGALEVHEVYQLDLTHTALVVLSACDTKLGKQSRGDDIVGLHRAFIYAGAPTVIASLWKVDDQAASEFMNHFYLHLHASRSPARALQAAQKLTRARYPHPYYWAAFVLTGHPGISADQISWLLIIIIILLMMTVILVISHISSL